MLKVRIHKIENATDTEKVKVSHACKMLGIILNSNIFKDEFMNLNLSDTKGMNTTQLFNSIFQGVETANGIKDQEMDLIITLFENTNNIGGMADEDHNTMRLNRYNLDSTSTTASVIMHEWLHNLGFNHRSRFDYTSVPYAVGHLVKDLVREWEAKIRASGIQPGKRMIVKRRFGCLCKKISWE